jgi:hypothetical protein
VFLLTDDRPKMLAGGPGLRLDRNEAANDALLTDLRTDKGMGWVPPHMWFTYLKLDVPARTLDYDLAVSVKPGAVPSLTAAGVTAAQARRIDVRPGHALWPVPAALLIGAATFGLVTVVTKRRRTTGLPA